MSEHGSVLCCPDKFRGSLTAHEAAAAIAAGVRRAGHRAVALPLADGGEGTLDVLCPDPGDRRMQPVTGPLGKRVEAEWGMRGNTAVVEMARASGLALVEGENDPMRATTRGTGELVRAAIDAGATRVIVTVGGSATVDGGLGALEALGFDLHGVSVDVACDVATPFLDAPRLFGPQKGAGPTEVEALEQRLAALAERYRKEGGVDVRGLAGGGAAGGLAGGLAALGARLVPGASLVADAVGLRDALAAASLALTGEGRFDATSLAGKVVGHVVDECHGLGLPVGVVAGTADWDGLPADVRRTTLDERAESTAEAHADAARLLADAAEELVGAR